jgi:hypothetical protein
LPDDEHELVERAPRARHPMPGAGRSRRGAGSSWLSLWGQLLGKQIQHRSALQGGLDHTPLWSPWSVASARTYTRCEPICCALPRYWIAEYTRTTGPAHATGDVLRADRAGQERTTQRQPTGGTK